MEGTAIILHVYTSQSGTKLASFPGPFEGERERAWYTLFAHARDYHRKSCECMTPTVRHERVSIECSSKMLAHLSLPQVSNCRDSVTQFCHRVKVSRAMEQSITWTDYESILTPWNITLTCTRPLSSPQNQPGNEARTKHVKSKSGSEPTATSWTLHKCILHMNLLDIAHS